ncbi:YaiI/YqxD family protein [Treponema sp.]|uniref:YaiI/YqxD family protein n=1 Tax=Treponema sp. TaxID=166 RepID=UPI003FA21A99
MTFFVDADSCPVRIREIICKTAQRLQKPALFVANRLIPIPKMSYCKTLITGAEDQAADTYILTHAVPGDIVITRDIPLAKQLVDEHICVLNDRGTVYTAENINERLSLRDFMYELSANGLAPERTKAFGKKEIMEFACSFDRETQKVLKSAREST